MTVNVPPNFASAASRHLQTAKFLFENKHHDDSAYIAGYVVDCAIKAIIEIACRPPKIHDLAKLSGEALNLAADLSYAARSYQVDLSSSLSSLQSKWSPDLRYCSSGFIKEHEAKSFVESADQIYHVTIGAMFLDGLLERLL